MSLDSFSWPAKRATDVSQLIRSFIARISPKVCVIVHDGHGMMMKHLGGHGHSADRDLDLTAEEVRTLVQARMIMHGNDRLKVGQVTAQNDDTYLVDVVTVDDSLVRQVEIDRDTGFPRGPAPAEQ